MITADILTASVTAAIASTAISALSSLLNFRIRARSGEKAGDESKDALVSINMPDGLEVHLTMTANEARALSQSHEKSISSSF